MSLIKKMVLSVGLVSIFGISANSHLFLNGASIGSAADVLVKKFGESLISAREYFFRFYELRTPASIDIKME